jgi:hypothetical protein
MQTNVFWTRLNCGKIYDQKYGKLSLYMLRKHICIAKAILSLGTRLSWMVSLTTRPLYPRLKAPPPPHIPNKEEVGWTPKPVPSGIRTLGRLTPSQVTIQNYCCGFNFINLCEESLALAFILAKESYRLTASQDKRLNEDGAIKLTLGSSQIDDLSQQPIASATVQ